MKLNKCNQCGKRKAKRQFCSYLCYARFAIKHGMWGPKWSPQLFPGQARQVDSKQAARHAVMRDLKKA